MQTPVHPRPGAPGTGSRRRALAGGLALLAAVATLALPMAPAAAAPEAGQYVQVAPTTVVNNVSVPAGGITSLRVTGANGIPAPAEVSAVAVNVVANQPSGAGWLQAYPEGDRPVDSTLNFSQGRTTANFEVVPIPADGRISIFSTTATKVIVRLRGWYSVAPAPEGGDWAQEGNGPAHLGTNDAEPVLTPSTVGGLGLGLGRRRQHAGPLRSGGGRPGGLHGRVQRHGVRAGRSHRRHHLDGRRRK
jgi:hypothetical protein